MKKKKFISMLAVCILVVICICKFWFGGRYKIFIENNTDKVIENIELKYDDAHSIATISRIEPKKTLEYDVETNSIQGEKAINLTYKDKKGNAYEESVAYLEKGYEGKTNIIINSVDIDGKLEMAANES